MGKKNEEQEARGLPEERLVKSPKLDVFDQLAQKEAKEEKRIAELRLKALDKLEQRRFNAAEAKKMADESLVQITRLYKCIKDIALEGYVRLEWNYDYLSDVCKDNIIKTLKDDGLDVLVQKKIIIIKW